jgi:hypothetical protein
MSVQTYRSIALHVAMWIFLGPLIVLLGLLDLATAGRSRNWPFAPTA